MTADGVIPPPAERARVAEVGKVADAPLTEYRFTIEIHVVAENLNMAREKLARNIKASFKVERVEEVTHG